MEEKFKQIISAEIASSNKTEIVELIYELIVKKNLDKKAIRNKVIKSDFNRLYKTTVPVMDIYYDLSVTYDLTPDMIRYIIKG